MMLETRTVSLDQFNRMRAIRAARTALLFVGTIDHIPATWPEGLVCEEEHGEYRARKQRTWKRTTNRVRFRNGRRELTCCICGKWLHEGLFWECKRTSVGRQSACKKCQMAERKRKQSQCHPPTATPE